MADVDSAQRASQFVPPPCTERTAEDVVRMWKNQMSLSIDDIYLLVQAVRRHRKDRSTPRVIMVEGQPWVSHEFHQRMLSETVPCDDAAIERGAEWLYANLPSGNNLERLREVAAAVLRAAGGTP